jgi:2,3-bisphosphoglycerate-dependent phosphoglycerate mutase
VYFITLLRHGESEGNCSGVIQGQSDYPLTPAGIQQAQDLARHWKVHAVQFDLIISSPLKRASQTAEIIGNTLNVQVEFDPAWMERHFGTLQDSNLDEIDYNYPAIDFFHPYDPMGGTGESQVDLYSRASLALQRIVRQPAGSYLVVSHGAILNKALYFILGITPQGHYNSPIFHFTNAGYAQFRYNSATRQWAVLSFNNQLAGDQIEGQNFWQQD